MILYRIAKAAYARDLSGTGARVHGGRWNRKGTPVLYTASSAALATVELLVHVDTHLQPSDLRLVYVYVPDSASSRTVEPNELPKGWRTFPAPASLAEMGTRWAVDRESLILRVPSAVVVEEQNVLVNPVHPEFGDVRVERSRPYGLDQRLLRRP